jgi:hypothetical protein
MIITEEQFDETIERAFTRGMEFQKKNQQNLEKAWFDIGYNAGIKVARLNQGEYDAMQQD